MTKKGNRRNNSKTPPGRKRSAPWGLFTIAILICWGIIIWLLPMDQEEKAKSDHPQHVSKPLPAPKENVKEPKRPEVVKNEKPLEIPKKESPPPEVKPAKPEPAPVPEKPVIKEYNPTTPLPTTPPPVISSNSEPVTPTPAPVPTPVPPHPQAPVRAEPVAPEQVKPAEAIPTEEPIKDLDFAAWQVALERHHFSAGTIDGDVGMRSRRSILQYQKSEGLPLTGVLDYETRLRVGKPNQPFIPYTITEDDMKKVSPPPHTWKEKAASTYLGYADPWFMLADKGHTTVKFLKILNPGIDTPVAGDSVVIPNVTPNEKEKLPPIARIRIILSETTLLAFDASDKLILCFPCSIAADKNKVPNGALNVAVIAPNPNYTYNPEMFPIDSKTEGITNRLVIPPGPNNPVGLAWIGLSQPGYGIHGTPDATAISRTGSHGCFRLANWNAVTLCGLVRRGIPVEVVP